MLGLLLVGMAVATAVLTALAARLSSLVSTLLLAYLAFVANLVLVTLVLSPFREVTRGGLAVAEVVLLAGAAAAWWTRGRPGPPLVAARMAARQVVSSPVLAAFAGLVALVLLYELLLVLTVPPNNGDSLAYHLAKAAAWAQHGGWFWVPNAPTVRMNAFQPLAELQILFVFVATGTGALYALPQFVAELAILVAVYGAARRLGFEVRASAASAFLARHLLARRAGVDDGAERPRRGLVPGGGGVPAARARSPGAGPGGRGRCARPWREAHDRARAARPGLAGARARPAHGGREGWSEASPPSSRSACGATCSTSSRRVRCSAPAPARCSTARRRRTPEASRTPSTSCSRPSTRACSRIAGSTCSPSAGVLAGVAAAGWALRRSGVGRAVGDAAGVATPFLAPLVVIGAAGVIAFLARKWGHPIRGPGGIAETENFRPLARVVYLSVNDAAVAATREDLRYVVITSGTDGMAADTFRQAGWNVQPLGTRLLEPRHRAERRHGHALSVVRTASRAATRTRRGSRPPCAPA